MKTLLFTLSALLIVLTTGCDTLIQVMNSQQTPIYVEVDDGYPAYIFPASLADESGAEYLVNDDTATYWTPTEDDVELAEEAFQAEVADRVAEITRVENGNTAMEIVQNRIPDYYRHFVGFVQNDHRWIYGVYFCQDIPGWGEHMPRILGGGTCLVHFRYDLDANSLTALTIEGR
jgi:hypothetical protein